MVDEFEIAGVTAQDLPSVLRWMTDYYHEGDARSGEKHFADHFDGGTTFIARHGKDIVGSVTIRWVSKSLERATGKKIPYIHQIEVADPYKRRGLGNRLLAAAESRIAERSDKAAICVGLD